MDIINQGEILWDFLNPAEDSDWFIPYIIVFFEAKFMNRSTRIFFISGLMSILMILVLDNTFDYVEYEKHWNDILSGRNPWYSGSSNAYGPLHNLLSFLYYLSPKGPRILFVLSAFFTSFFLYNRINQLDLKENGVLKMFLLLIIVNPIIWIFFVVNGCNDGLVASMLIFGIYFYDKKCYLMAAFLISLSILYKYIPLFILPVLFVNNKEIKWKFAFFTFLFLVIGSALTYYIWGDSILNMIEYTASRESKILSIFRYLRGEYSFLKWFGVSNVDFLSSFLVLISVAIVFLVQLFFNWNYLKAVLVTLLGVYLFYKIGHFQFYIIIYFLLIYYLSTEENSVNFDFIKGRILVFLIWIAFVTVLYVVTEGFYNKFSFIRDIIGLPNTVFLIFLLHGFIKISANQNKMVTEIE